MLCVKRLWVVVIAVLGLLGCSGSDTPAAIDDLGWTDSIHTTYEGEPLWYSLSARTVYAEDCVTTGQATGTVSLPFSGFGQICPNPSYRG